MLTNVERHKSQKSSFIVQASLSRGQTSEQDQGCVRETDRLGVSVWAEHKGFQLFIC